MKKFQFSKVIVVFTGILTVLVSLFSCYMIFDTKDLTPLCYLIPAIFAECAAANASYYSKAKAENTLYIANKIKEEKIDINAVKVANSISTGTDINVSAAVTEIAQENIEEIQG